MTSRETGKHDATQKLEPITPDGETHYTLPKLLSHMGIQKVVFVDDALNTEQDSWPQVYAALLSFTDITALPEPFSGLDLNGTFAESNRIEAKTRWEALNGDQQSQLILSLGSDIAAVSEGDEQDDPTLSVLAELLEGANYTPIQPQAWEFTLNQLLEEKTKTLVIMDLNLQHAKMPELGDEGGMKLLIEAVEKDTNHILEFALLSHEFGADQEEAETERLLEKYGQTFDRLVAISKERVLRAKEPDEKPLLIGRFRLALIGRLTRQMKKEASYVIENANREALKRIQALSIEEFDYIVFKRSQDEGIPEIDTMLRLFTLYSRAETRRAAATSQNMRDLAQQTNAMRAFETNREEKPKNTWKVQRLEWYEDPIYLSKHHIQLDLGDLFLNEGGQYFILLTAQCDIALRSNGKRNAAIRRLTLAEVETGEDIEQRATQHQEQYYRLKYFDENSGQPALINLRKSYSVVPVVLDMCVHNSSGGASSIFDSDSFATLPTVLRLQREVLLKQLFAALNDQKKIREMIQRQREAKKHIHEGKLGIDLPTFQESHADQFLPFLDDQKIYSARYEKLTESVSYSIKRVGKLLQPFSGELLARFSGYRARYGFDVDFG